MGLGKRVNTVVDKYTKKYQLRGRMNKVVNQKNFKYFAAIFFVFKFYKLYHLQLEKNIFYEVLETIKSEENEIITYLKEGKIYEEGFLETKILSSEDKLKLYELFELKKPKV